METDTETYENTEGVHRHARPVTPVLLAEVLLRVLEKLSGQDSDQEYIDLYNSLKPAVEPLLRNGKTSSPMMGKDLGNGFSS